MGFYLSQKDQVFNPWPGFSRSTGPVDRATCTSLAGGPVDRDGRPSRELCSLESLGRPCWSTGRESALCSRGSVDRADRPKPQRSDLWPLAVDRPRSVRPPTASFSSSINWGIWGLFSTRFLVGFELVFPTSLKEFSPLNWELILPIKRGVLSRVLKEIFLSFPPPSLSLFSHTNTWAIHWLFIL